MLFKILRGPSSRISKDTTEFHDGYAYFTPDDGGFYIDAETESTDPDGAVQQKRIRVNPVMSVNGSTGDVTLPTVFVVKLSGSGTTADPYVTDKTFDELNEAYDRGDICILRFGGEAVEFALTYMYADLACFNRLFLSGSKTMQEVSWDGNSGKIQVTTIDIRESLDQSVTGQEIPTAEAVWNAIPHPEAKTDAQTQSVGADSDGTLWTAPSPVTSVNNKTGAVSLMASDVNAIPSNLTGTAGQVLTKTADGQEWADAPVDENSVLLKNINIALPVSGRFNRWYSVTYGNGKFVAVSDGSDTAAYSTDGITWMQSTLPLSADWESVTYGNGKFVAVANGSTTAAYSTDGINWVQSTLPTKIKWSSVTYGDGKFVAVAKSSSVTAYSTDGINWVQSKLPTMNFWYSVTYGNGKFVAFARGSDIAAYSTDGISWVQSTLPIYASWQSVTYGSSKFVAVASSGSGSTNAITAYSENGINWIQSTPPSTGWSSVTYGDGKFVAVANGSTTAAYSTDGINWTESTLPISANWNSVTHADGKFVAVALGSTTAAYSTDGVVWTSTVPVIQCPDGTDIHEQVKDALQIEMPDTTITTDTSTKITGLLKGANGKVAQAVPGTDYVIPSALDNLKEYYFATTGTLSAQNLTIAEPSAVSEMAQALNSLILSGDTIMPVDTTRPCIIARGNSDAETRVVLKYTGVGPDESHAIFSGIWHDAANELQYSVSLLLNLGNAEFAQYNVVSLKEISTSNLDNLTECYFNTNGNLLDQNLTVEDASNLSMLAETLNEIINAGAAKTSISTARPCLMAYGSDNIEEAVVLKYTGAGDSSDTAIFGGVLYDASGDVQYAVSLLYRFQNSGFEKYNIVQLKEISPSTTTPLAPTEAGSVGTSTAYARGDHVHPKQTVTKSDVGLGNVDNVSINTRLNRTTNVNAADANYTTYMARGEALFSTETTPTVNGCIAWQYG